MMQTYDPVGSDSVFFACTNRRVINSFISCCTVDLVILTFDSLSYKFVALSGHRVCLVYVVTWPSIVFSSRCCFSVCLCFTVVLPSGPGPPKEKLYDNWIIFTA